MSSTAALNVNDLFYNYLNQSNLLDDIENVLMQNGQTFYVDLNNLNNFNTLLSSEIQQNFTNLFGDLQSIFDAFCTDKFDRKLDLSFKNNLLRMKIRDLKSNQLNKLISFTGTVTRVSQVRPELVMASFTCNVCHTVINNIQQNNSYTEPIYCPNNLCNNRSLFSLNTNNCTFSNWQKLTIQESTEEIPKGSLPRNIDVIVRNELCEQIQPGSHCVFTGYLVIVDEINNSRMPNNTLVSELQGENNNDTKTRRSTNLKEMNFKFNFIGIEISIKTNMNNFNYNNILLNNNTSDIYNKLSESLFPTIFGHSNIKNAILLMLVGGCEKKEDIKLRGDINILLVGDPGTAKSQFLKQTSQLLDRCVYTSGKSSSAAGLTAAIVKNEMNDFTIDAGALMLSDNGICCIDEFDKMTYKDQVSIHEAMEQQSITISKAGINATLNARCSVLAAANPIKGRYDTKKSLRTNVNMSPAIMSRFDLYFVLIDKIDRKNDEIISKYILDIHSINNESDLIDNFNENIINYSNLTNNALFTIPECISYIKKVKENRPIIIEAAQIELNNKYILLRQESLVNTNNYRMTIRHLESMIRLSEALAKLHNTNVEVVHVNEAFRLIKSSLIEIKQSDIILFGEMENNTENAQSIKLTQKEYSTIVNALIYLIKHNNYTKTEATLEYIKLVEDKIESAAQLENEKKKVGEVLRILVESEGILYEVGDSEGSGDVESKILKIHEAYDI